MLKITMTNYDDNKFWNVIKKFAGKIGKDVIGKALSLYYVLKKDNTPLSIKGIVVMMGMMFIVIFVSVQPCGWIWRR